MPSASSRSRMFSLPPLLLYILVGIFVVTWVLLATGGFFGNRLYDEYLELKDQNLHLLQKERELEALRHTMEQIQKQENIIRDYLGLEKEANEE